MMDTMVKVHPVGAVHMDDDSECTAPGACGRLVYWTGGAPSELPTLAE